MKKQEIRQAVEKAKAAHLPTAIKEEGRYRASDEVRQAMYEEPEDTPAEPAPAQSASGVTVIRPDQIEQKLGH